MRNWSIRSHAQALTAKPPHSHLCRSSPSSSSLLERDMCGRLCVLTLSRPLGLTLGMWNRSLVIKTPSIYYQMLVLGGAPSCSALSFLNSNSVLMLTRMQTPGPEIRLYIHLILCSKAECFATVWATVCSSWVWINRYTSCRSLLLPEGDTSKRYIEQANCMMSRTLACMYMYPREFIGLEVTEGLATELPIVMPMRCVLLLALTVACGGSFLLEQPASSLMGEYFKMQWLCSKIPVTWLDCSLWVCHTEGSNSV